MKEKVREIKKKEKGNEGNAFVQGVSMTDQRLLFGMILFGGDRKWGDIVSFDSFLFCPSFVIIRADQSTACSSLLNV